MPVNAGEIQVKGRFKKGQSGNPNGKPKGARNRSTMAAEALLAGSLEGICRKIEEEALAGNMLAARMVLERFLPVRKDRAVRIDLPQLKTCEDVLSAIGCILTAVGCGEISPSEGEALSRTLDMYSKALENHQLEARLQVLEAAAKKQDEEGK
ncbi:MAG: DUF5681 domain-containing protein [Chlamydiales bacterium]|nr:DUF5681 domain-containing protein [Chlamydiales bacterium]